MHSTKSRVLVVDDDPVLLSLLVDTLQTIGYAVTGAQGGIAALDALKTDRFDLMVTDIRMPDLDGIQLLKRVRRHYPGMPVLFITAYASNDIIGRATPDGFLAKPFRISHIEELIERTLERKHSTSGRSTRKVLVVDRDDAFRTSLTEALNYSHYIPFAAKDAIEAMHEMEHGTFDAVITDVADSELDGLAIAEMVSEKYPKTPVIALGREESTSPEATPAKDQEAGSASHFAGFLRKPFHFGAVLELLEKVTPMVI